MSRGLSVTSSARPEPPGDRGSTRHRRANGPAGSGARARAPAIPAGYRDPFMTYTPQQRLEAAQWFFDIHDSQEPSPELLQEWLRWLDAAPDNRSAFEAVERAYRDVPVDRVTRATPTADVEPPYD